MRTPIILLAVALALTSWQASAQQPAPPATDRHGLVLVELNAVRAVKGLAPVVRNAALDLAAQKHADVLTAQGEPKGNPHILAGKDHKDRAEAEGYGAAVIGEVIHFGASTPAAAVMAFANSPPHYAIITHEAMQEAGIGIGTPTKDGRIWFVIMLAKSR